MSSRTGAGRAVAATIVFGMLATTPRAASVIAPTFDAMVTRAQAVFVGQTLDVHSRWVSTSSGRAIVTVVTFKVTRTLKGELGGQTQLEFLGGTVGEYRMEVPGIPRFRVGDEDVLFVDERGQPVSVADIGAAAPAPRVASARALSLASFEDEIVRAVRRQREAR